MINKGKKIKKENNLVFVILFEVYCLSLLIGQTLYIFFPKLQFLRIFSICLFVFFILYWTKFYIKKELFYFLLFFVLYMVFLLLSSIRKINFFLSNAMINYIVLMLIIFNLSVFFTMINRIIISRILIKIIYVYLILCNLIALWEIITQNHLPVSKFSVQNNNYFFLHIPTTFFTNENDYMSIYLLLFLLLISIKKNILKEKILFFDFILLSLLVFQSFITGARLVQLCLVIFVFMTFIQKKIQIIFLLLALFLYIYLLNFDTINVTLIEMFSNQGSNEVRKNLYLLALDSLFNIDSTMFLGLGMNGAVNFYKNVKTDLFIAGIEAPHNFLCELILNCGFFMTSLFVCLVIYILIKLQKTKYLYLRNIMLLYFIILCAPASAVFLWPQYLVLFTVFYYSCYKTSNSNL